MNEDPRVIRAVCLGLASGAAFWVATYVVIRHAVEHFRR